MAMGFYIEIKQIGFYDSCPPPRKYELFSNKETPWPWSSSIGIYRRVNPIALNSCRVRIGNLRAASSTLAQGFAEASLLPSLPSLPTPTLLLSLPFWPSPLGLPVLVLLALPSEVAGERGTARNAKACARRRALAFTLRDSLATVVVVLPLLPSLLWWLLRFPSPRLSTTSASEQLKAS